MHLKKCRNRWNNIKDALYFESGLNLLLSNTIVFRKTSKIFFMWFFMRVEWLCHSWGSVLLKFHRHWTGMTTMLNKWKFRKVFWFFLWLYSDYSRLLYCFISQGQFGSTQTAIEWWADDVILTGQADVTQTFTVISSNDFWLVIDTQLNCVYDH